MSQQIAWKAPYPVDAQNAKISDTLSDRHDPMLRKRKLKSQIAMSVCLACTVIAGLSLAILLSKVFLSGWDWLSWEFLQNPPSRFAHRAGIAPAMWGSVWLLGLTTVIAVPLGVGAAVYLHEFMPRSRFKQFVDLNVANLTSVPSIIFGILGLAIFVRYLDMGRSLLAGASTLAMLVLPIIIVATREALAAVPNELRQAALAVGATKWQTTRDHVLPAALPNILTGIILSLSRAIGETAPLIIVGALSFVAFTPEGPFDEFTALPIQIFNWASRPQMDFHDLAAAGIIVLLTVLLSVNAIAILLRNHFQRKNLCNRL